MFYCWAQTTSSCHMHHTLWTRLHSTPTFSIFHISFPEYNTLFSLAVIRSSFRKQGEIDEYKIINQPQLVNIVDLSLAWLWYCGGEHDRNFGLFLYFFILLLESNSQLFQVSTHVDFQKNGSAWGIFFMSVVKTYSLLLEVILLLAFVKRSTFVSRNFNFPQMY